MNNKIVNVVMFTVGAVVGSAVTWGLIRSKYEQIVQEEIASVREEYSSLMQKVKNSTDDNTISDSEGTSEDEYDDEEDDDSDSTTDSDLVEYNRIVRRYHITPTYDENDEEGGTGDPDEAPYINGPYCITPEEFSSSPPGYSAQALDYYADGILADGWGVKLNIHETIGEDSLEEFSNYVDDVLYVRNERKQVDYEVTKDPRTYAEAVNTNPSPYSL